MLVQVPVMFQLNQSTLNKLYFLLFSLFFLQSCNENHENKNLPIHKEWIYDFNAETLDTNVWNIVNGNGCPQLCGFGNNELQHYTNSEENLHIKNGHLVISATYDSVFKSAKLTSENYIDFQTGSVEVSAKLPSARGTWPAIWLLPSLERPLNWPLDGEIDIMENVGYNPNYIFGTIHTAAYNHIKGTHLTDSIFIDDLDQIDEIAREEGVFTMIEGRKFGDETKAVVKESDFPKDEAFSMNVGGIVDINKMIEPLRAQR